MADNIDYGQLSDEERAELDRKLRIADGIKLYRSEAGSLGHGNRKASEALASQGGIPLDEATHLARYKQWKDSNAAKDPAFQGPLNINTGAREPELTDEERNAKRDQLLAAKGEERGRLWAEDKLRNERTRERLYDSLAGPGLPPAEEPAPASTGEAVAKAKEFLKRSQKRKAPVS